MTSGQSGAPRNYARNQGRATGVEQGEQSYPFGGVQQEPPKPGQRFYDPKGASREALFMRDRELLIAGPAGTGKSRGALEKLHVCASKYAGMRGLMLRKTLRSLRQSAMVTFEQKVLPVKSPVYFHGGDYEYRYPNGSIIVVGGLDKSSKVMSTEYDMAYIMEATELLEGDWEDVTTRLRNGVMPYQQLIADCNPTYPTHWLYRRIEAHKTTMLKSIHRDNPRLWDDRAPCGRCLDDKTSEPTGKVWDADSNSWLLCPSCLGTRRGWWTAEGIAYMAILDNLSGARRDRLRDGRWVQAEGVVYENWTGAPLHLIPRIPIPYNWRRWRVIDFGYKHPFVCQWWAEDTDGRLYLYREMVGTNKIVEEWARYIKQYSGQEVYAGTIVDHDAEDRATLEYHLGCRTISARKAVKTGIQRVTKRLQRAGDGKPRLFVMEDALLWRDQDLDYRKKPIGLKEEMETYRWNIGPDGSIIKEEPLKEDDHSQDAARYMVMQLDGGDAGADDALDELEHMLNS